jgi:hypothetical protein
VNLACGATEDAATGTLRGLIRIRTGERFFKTVTIRRMKATVQDTATRQTRCHHETCPQPESTLAAGYPFGSGSHLELTAITPIGRGPGLASEVVSVIEPTFGSAFDLIEHQITVVRRRAFLRPSRNLGRASLTTPGSILTGDLSIRASGALRRGPGWTCHGHRYKSFNRSARIVNGRVVAAFDSIGKWVFGRNLTVVGMTGDRRVS